MLAATRSTGRYAAAAFRRRPGLPPRALRHGAAAEHDPARPNNLTAAARGHGVICGTPTGIADTLGEWFVERAGDGYRYCRPISPAHSPILSTCLCRNSSTAASSAAKHDEGQTLRDHLGSARAAAPARLRQAAGAENDDGNLDATACKALAIDAVSYRMVAQQLRSEPTSKPAEATP